MRRFAAASAAVCLGLLAAGCGGNPVRDQSDNVAFTPCSQAECAGTLPSGADFDVIMPDEWNGTLAIFSHGLHRLTRTGVAPQESPATSPSPATTPTRPSNPDETDRASPSAPADPGELRASPSPVPRRGGPELAPRWAEGDRSIADVMLQAGYAIAGAAPPRTGWSVPEQITAAEELHDYFAGAIGDPNRVYVWGESTGGLVSAVLAERHPGWVSGALAMCAPLAGPRRSYDLALDVAYAVRQLLAPDLQLTGFASLDQAREARDLALRRLRRAANGPAAEQAKVVFIAAIGVLPTRSRDYDGASLESRIQANLVGIESLLEQSTVQRYQIEVDSGGNPSGNAGTDYALRISDTQREQIDSLAAGAADRYLAELEADRIVTDPAAAERAAELGDPSGELEVPVLTLHNVYDPVYVIQNQSAYAQRLAADSPEAQGNFVNLTAFPPARYSPAMPADEGAGNCNFQPRTLVGALILLNRWVRGGQYPGKDSMTESFRSQRVTLDYEPPPWPQMSGTPPASDSASAGAVAGARHRGASKVPQQGQRVRAKGDEQRRGGRR